MLKYLFELAENVTLGFDSQRKSPMHSTLFPADPEARGLAVPKLTLLTATRRLGGRIKAESLGRFTRVTFPAHWQRGAPHPACCHQGTCPVSCCALWLEAVVSLRMRPWCAARGASHRHSSQPLRPQLLILVTSALSE